MKNSFLKINLIFLMVLFVGVAQAVERGEPDRGTEFKVTAGFEGGELVVIATTTRGYNSYKALPVIALELNLPQAGERKPEPGLLAFDTGEADPLAPGLTVMGPRSSTLRLMVGEPIPAISSGKYDLFINDAYYGKLEVGKNKATLK